MNRWEIYREVVGRWKYIADRQIYTGKNKLVQVNRKYINE